MQKSLEISFLVGVIIVVVVIVFAITLLWSMGLFGGRSITQTNALKMCSAACMEDRRIDAVSIDGICVTLENSNFAGKTFKVEGVESTCFDFMDCRIKDSYGEECIVTEYSTDIEKACRIACELDGGVFDCMGDSCGIGTPKVDRVCKLNKLSINFHSTILNRQKCLHMGHCCRLPEYDCLVSWRNC